jgi:hypothetical protein
MRLVANGILVGLPSLLLPSIFAPVDDFEKYLFGPLKLTTWRPRFESCICIYREPLSFLLRASVDILRGPSGGWEGGIGFGIEGGESIVRGGVSDGKAAASGVYVLVLVQ